jgi:RHS repeat-associated protein
VDTVSTSTVYTFDWKGLVTKAETRTSGGVLAKEQAIEYDQFRLPTKVTERSYDSGGSAYRDEISMVEYDNKGNVTFAWSPLAEGNKSNVFYRTQYTYDTDYYSLMLSKEYWQDASTLIMEQFTPDIDTNRHVDLHEVRVYQGSTALKEKTGFGHDAYGNVTSVKRYRDDFINYAETEYSYPNGALLTEVRAAGIENADGTMAAGTPGYIAGTIVTKTGYDAMGLPITQTDANNLATGFQRNLRGDVTVVTNPDLTTRQYGRDYAQNTLLFTDERGAQTLFKFMAGMRTGQQAGHNGEAAVDVLSGDTLWYRRYDEVGRLEEEGDLYGKTRYAYDNISRLAQKQRRDNQNAVVAQEDYAYNEVYNGASQRRVQKTVLGEAGAPSVVTAVYTDKNGRAVQAGRFLGGTELLDAYTYDYVGNLLTEKTAFAADRGLAYSGKWEYDYAGRVTKAYNADGGYATNAYNSLGFMVSATDYAGTTSTYAYDDLGRLLEEKGVVEVNGGSTYYTMKRHTYDPAGNIKREEWTDNPVGSAAAWGKADYDYNSRSLLEYATAYDGVAVDSVAKYTYDGAGNVRFVEAGKSGKGAADGKVTEYTYDRFGNQLTMTDPLSQTETRQYNTSGLMTGKTDRNGNIFAYTYDGLKRPKTVTVTQGGAVAEVVTYGYYLTGAKKREESTTRGWLAYAYDSLGRLVVATESGGITKQYGYNKADSRETFLAQASSATVLDMSYTYDDQNRLSTVKQGGAVVGTYGYDANGNRDSLAYANGVTATYAYNKANWLTGMANQKGGATLSSYAYGYYADGNQRTKTDLGGRVSTYLYDGLGRLKSESESTGLSLTYDYDRHGNRSSMAASGTENYSSAYSYDGNNRLESEEKTEGALLHTTAYGYDANGNQTHWAKSTLAQAGQSQEEVSFVTGDAALYGYDAFNRMTSAYADGGLTEYAYRVDGLRQSKSAAAGSVAHVWDGANLVADMSGGAVIASYVRGINLLRANTSTGASYYVYNGHGDVTGLTNSSGVITWEYDYDAFGNEREIAGQAPSTDTNPFRYAGLYFDAESGAYYLRARYYQPRTGRFLSEDPVRSGMNYYIYASNNPIRFLDPLGLFDFDTVLSMANNKGVYNDDVKVLQNYLSQQGYYSVPWIPGEGRRYGYFDQALATAISAWKNAITPGSGKGVDFSGTVDLSWWTKTGGIWREEIDRNAGVEIATQGFKQYFDITTPIMNALGRDIGDFKANAGDLFWFAGQVGDAGPWNVKSNKGATWTKTLGISFWGYDAQMLLHGSFVSVEDTGNLTYGYLGTAAGFNTGWLVFGSSANHFKNHGIFGWENEFADQAMFKRGNSWYNTGVFN